MSRPSIVGQRRERLAVMDDRAAEIARHSKNVTAAVEAMSGLLEGYDHAAATGGAPDPGLIDYITRQMVRDGESIPAGIWDLLSGLTALNYLLLARVEELSGVPKQVSLDLYAHAAKKLNGDAKPSE